MQQVPIDVELKDADQPEYFDIEKSLWWRQSSKTKRQQHEYLVLSQGYPIEEAEWIPTSFFSDHDALQADIQANWIPKEQ